MVSPRLLCGLLRGLSGDVVGPPVTIEGLGNQSDDAGAGLTHLDIPEELALEEPGIGIQARTTLGHAAEGGNIRLGQ